MLTMIAPVVLAGLPVAYEIDFGPLANAARPTKYTIIFSFKGEPDVKMPEVAPPPRPKPSDEHIVANAALEFLLNSETTKSTREFYGVKDRKEIILLDGGKCRWPEGDFASLAGFKLHRGRPPEVKERILAVRLDDLDLGKGKESGRVALSVQSIGGDRIGGCTVVFIPMKENGRWVLRFRLLDDP